MIFTIILIICKLLFVYLLIRLFFIFKALKNGDSLKLNKLKRLKRLTKYSFILSVILMVSSSFIKIPVIAVQDSSKEELIVGTWQCLDGNPEMIFLETGEFYFGEIEGEWFFDNDELFLNSNGKYIELPLDHLEENHIHFYGPIRLDGNSYSTPNCRKF